ncbi:MAG TPA: hypothetical protein VIO61_13525 [Anaerolineaceae bacterium]
MRQPLNPRLNSGWLFLINVFWKGITLFLLINLVFAAVDPVDRIAKISAYNVLFPGRPRLPFGEDPGKSYNFSLFSLEAMFASHEIAALPKHPGEFRVILLGDSSVWGTLLKPEETLSSQLEARVSSKCDGKRVRIYNLGYPTISLTKDVLILAEAMDYQPDLIIWLTTLEAFPSDKQVTSPLVAHNYHRLENLVSEWGLNINLDDPEIYHLSLFGQTIIGRRRDLADLARLQLYGILWSATGIDQVYPQQYPKPQVDLTSDPSYHGWLPQDLPRSELALDILDTGMLIAGRVPVVLVNEPIMISNGKNSDLRYNFYYPRWAYDQYRRLLQEKSHQMSWKYLDVWDRVPAQEFTNSAIHLTPFGINILAEQLETTLEQEVCK